MPASPEWEYTGNLAEGGAGVELFCLSRILRRAIISKQTNGWFTAAWTAQHAPQHLGRRSSAEAEEFTCGVR